MPGLALEYKTTRCWEVLADHCDVKEFSEFLVKTLSKMVEPVKQDAFFKPQRYDHNGKPIQQESKLAKVDVNKTKTVNGKPVKQERIVAKVDVRKVKPRMPVVSEKVKSLAFVKRVQNPKTYSKIVKK